MSRKLCLIALLVALANLQAIDRAVALDPLKSGTELAVRGAAPGDKLNMRENASAQSKIVMELPPNASGIIATGRTEQNEADTWIEIKFGGKIGWVHSRFISTKETRSEPVAADTKLAVITDKTTGVRILLPTGIVTKTSTTKFGQNWSSPDDAISIDALSFGKADRLNDLYDRLRSKTGRILTRSELTVDGFILVGRDGDTVRFRIEARQKGNSIRGLSVAYASKRQDEFGALTEKVFASFDPFPDQQPEHQPSAAVTKAPAKPSASAAEECDSSELDRRLRGCSSLIDSLDVAPTIRAIAYSRRSDSYIESKDFDKAIADRTEALKLEPSDKLYAPRLSVAHYLRGLTYSKNKDYEKAIADYSSALQHDDKNEAALHARALTLAEKGDIDSAIVDLANAVRVDSTNETSRRQLAALYQRRGAEHFAQSKFTSAGDDYSEAINLAGDRVDLYLMRANVYLVQDDQPSAG